MTHCNFLFRFSLLFALAAATIVYSEAGTLNKRGSAIESSLAVTKSIIVNAAVDDAYRVHMNDWFDMFYTVKPN